MKPEISEALPFSEDDDARGVVSAVKDRPIDRCIVAFEMREVFRWNVLEAEDGLDRAVLDRVADARHDSLGGDGENGSAHARGFVTRASRGLTLRLSLG